MRQIYEITQPASFNKKGCFIKPVRISKKITWPPKKSTDAETTEKFNHDWKKDINSLRMCFEKNRIGSCDLQSTEIYTETSRWGFHARQLKHSFPDHRIERKGSASTRSDASTENDDKSSIHGNSDAATTVGSVSKKTRVGPPANQVIVKSIKPAVTEEKAEEDVEYPSTGTTRSLIAKWKAMEGQPLGDAEAEKRISHYGSCSVLTHTEAHQAAANDLKMNEHTDYRHQLRNPSCEFPSKLSRDKDPKAGEPILNTIQERKQESVPQQQEMAAKALHIKEMVEMFRSLEKVDSILPTPENSRRLQNMAVFHSKPDVVKSSIIHGQTAMSDGANNVGKSADEVNNFLSDVDSSEVEDDIETDNTEN